MFADPWAQLGKPERFGKDVRNIHQNKSKEILQRAHEEKMRSSVPLRDRAPEFQVNLLPTVGEESKERRIKNKVALAVAKRILRPSFFSTIAASTSGPLSLIMIVGGFHP